MRRYHSVVPERYWVLHSRLPKTLENFKRVAGIVLREAQRLYMCILKRLMFHCWSAATDAKDVVV